MKYIKLFQTIADKQAAELDYPNTNYVVENSKASIEKEAPEKRLIAVYNVTSTTEPTIIIDYQVYASLVSSMEVDGVQQPSVTSDFTFSTTGEHTIKYKLIDDTKLGAWLFVDCFSLTSVIIPDGVTSIESSVFNSCSGLTSITIPDGVTTIGQTVFADCRSLTSVTIPDSVTSIGAITFVNCSTLTSITVNATTPPTLGADVFNSTNNCPIYVPSASVNAYKAATGWSTYASRIQAIQ